MDILLPMIDDGNWSLQGNQDGPAYRTLVLYVNGEPVWGYWPPTPSREPYQQALARAAELGMRPLQDHCHRGLGLLYTKTGQQAQARAELSTAMEMYRTMEMTFWLPQVEAALAQVE